jgi:hypothetical protein
MVLLIEFSNALSKLKNPNNFGKIKLAFKADSKLLKKGFSEIEGPLCASNAMRYLNCSISAPLKILLILLVNTVAKP